MATYYINVDSGDNANDGSEGSPWETLPYAISNSAATDTIILQEATSSYPLTSNISPSARIIQGESTEDCVIDGGATNSSINLGGGSFENITFTNFVYSSDRTGLFELTNSTDTTIENCIIYDITVYSDYCGVAYYQAGGNIDFISCSIYDIKSDVNVSSNISVFAGNSDSGATTTLTNVTVNITATGNASLRKIFDEANVYYTVEATVINSIFSGTGSETFEGVGSMTITYSCVHNTSDTPSGTGVITSDPQFIDKDNNDVRLRQGSPCIDQGTII